MRRHVNLPPPPLLLFVLILLPSILTVANASLIKINWTSGVNFTTWTSDKRFFVGDWLLFYFNKYQYSVLEVNKSSYEKCIETDFLTNVTKGGRDVFELNETRPYYFISGFGQCWGGVKLSINVEDIPPPKPSPSKNGSPVFKSSFEVWKLLVSLACVVFNAMLA